jgi:transposase-like protein
MKHYGPFAAGQLMDGLGAGHYERTTDRRSHANGYKSKRIDTPAGTVEVAVPNTAGHSAEPFFPQSLERGCRSVRAVMLAVAEMYVKGVSTRQAEAVLREFGIEGLSSSQVSRAATLLDDELEAWRTRPLGEIRYLILDARYEKMRAGGVVRDAAVLSAIGIGPDERRRRAAQSARRQRRAVRGPSPLARFPRRPRRARYARR